MKKHDPNKVKQQFFYDEEGANQVAAQITDSYTSGVVGEPNVHFDSDEGYKQ